jgi:hypothetical protein
VYTDTRTYTLFSFLTSSTYSSRSSRARSEHGVVHRCAPGEAGGTRRCRGLVDGYVYSAVDALEALGGGLFGVRWEDELSPRVEKSIGVVHS